MKPETLREALDRMLATVECATVTRINHGQYAGYLVRYFGDRPLSDFAGLEGGELVMQYLVDETRGRDRGLREAFSGSGNLVNRLSYNSVRMRLNTLRHALTLAIERGALASMPDPWPIPPRGSHGQLNRGRFLLREQLDAALAKRPPKRRVPPTVRATGADLAAPEGEETLGAAFGRLLKSGLRRATAATREMHDWNRRKLLRFFGDRPVRDFEASKGYALLEEFITAEGPEGRGVKYVTLKKVIVTLRMTLRLAARFGTFGAMAPEWPELPCDGEPRERYLTDEEYVRLRDAIDPRWRLFVDLGVWTGQHSSDLFTMTWGMVDLGNGPGAPPGPGVGFWFRRNTKNKARPRWLELPAELCRLLTEEYPRRRPAPEDCIVGFWQNARQTIKRACWRLSMPHVAPIDLRHTCATWWVSRGGSKDALRIWLGHSSTSGMIERHYLSVTPDMLDSSVAAFNRRTVPPAAPRPAPAPAAPMLPPADEGPIVPDAVHPPPKSRKRLPAQPAAPRRGKGDREP